LHFGFKIYRDSVSASKWENAVEGGRGDRLEKEIAAGPAASDAGKSIVLTDLANNKSSVLAS